METSRTEEEKRNLRKQMKALRAQIAAGQKALWDQALAAQVLALVKEFRPGAVLAYASLGNEAGTGAILEELWRRKIPVALPRVRGRDMDFFFLTESSDLAPGFRGILEPVYGLKRWDGTVDQGETVLVLAPGLAFDRQGGRLGYGGGYYDRFLERTFGAVTVGLAYEFQIVEQVPAQSHDRRVDLLAAPGGRIICRRKKA